MTSLTDLINRKRIGPVNKPLRVKVAAVAEPYNYDSGSDKALLKVALCDATAMARAVVFDASKFGHFNDNAGLVLHNEIYNKNGEIVITQQTRVFSSTPPQVPEKLLNEAIQVIRPTPPDVVDIAVAKKSPSKMRTSIRGKIVNEILPTSVIVNNKDVIVKAITVEDNTDTVKVSLWRDLTTKPIALGDVVEISHVIANDKRYNNEDSLSSTHFTQIKITELPDTTITDELLGCEVEDITSNIITAEKAIFSAENTCLQNQFDCPLGDIALKCPLKITFKAKGQNIVSFL